MNSMVIFHSCVKLPEGKRCNTTGMEHGWKKLVGQRDSNLGEMPLRTLLGLNPLLLGWNPSCFMEENNV